MQYTESTTKAMTNEIMKLKAIGIDLPKEIGEITFIEQFNPHLLKYLSYLKLFYFAAFIALIFVTEYHLQIHEKIWDIHAYMLVFWLCIAGMIFLIQWFFRKYEIKIAGENGFIVYGFRFSVKSPKKTLVFYDNIEKLIHYEGGDEWWRRYKNKYYQYDFIQNDKIVYTNTIYWDEESDDNPDFVLHILENWENSVAPAK